MMREKLNDRLKRYGYKDGMSIVDFHRQLMERHGCETCDNRGDNGCGVAFIDGFEFFDPYDGDEDESVELNDDDCPFCEYRNREEDDRRELKELRKRAADGTLVFVRAIQEALRLMPTGCSPDVYGDIVRSAAAVSCHQMGSD